MSDYGAPHTLRIQRLPTEVYQHLVDATQTNRYHANLVSVRFDLSSEECKAISHFGVNLAKDFPVLLEIRPEHLEFIITGIDNEHPQCPYTFVKFQHPAQGSLYFLFQNLQPSYFFNTFAEDHMTPMFPKEGAAERVKPGTSIALAKVCACCLAIFRLFNFALDHAGCAVCLLQLLETFRG
jgi:hypothetical protein